MYLGRLASGSGDRTVRLCAQERHAARLTVTRVLSARWHFHQTANNYADNHVESKGVFCGVEEGKKSGVRADLLRSSHRDINFIRTRQKMR